jgi:hypothetical protein
MIPNSNAYLRLREQSQGFLDFVVLSCTAVPALKQHLHTLGVKGLAPDHFKGTPNSALLLTYVHDYQGPLARSTVLTLWSFFEAYVKALLIEIIDFHGGAATFQANANRRAKSFLASSSPQILEAKRKLQEPARAAKRGRYQKHSKSLVGLGFRFPSELLAPYGVKTLIERARPRGSKAYQIPELLRDALCFPLNDATLARIETIRATRNDIAHGTHVAITLKRALEVAKELRDVAAQVDRHATEHFFIIEAFA